MAKGKGTKYMAKGGSAKGKGKGTKYMAKGGMANGKGIVTGKQSHVACL